MPTLTIELLNPKARAILDGLEDAGLIVIGKLPQLMNSQSFVENEFWHQKSVDELAEEQGVGPINDLDRLFGCGKDLWETKEEWDDYMEVIRTRRIFRVSQA